MTWSKSFSSLKDFNDAECPDDINEEQWDAAVAAAKALIKSGPVREARASASHLKHPDNAEAQTPQAQININIFGSGDGKPTSIGCSVAEI